jgi:hypothetical protein
MFNLNARDYAIHDRALRVSQTIRKCHREMVEILIAVEDAKIHKKLGKPSTFVYATEILGLEESVAYSLIAVARKAKVVPSLRNAIAAARVTPSKAGRMVSILTTANAEELIEFAATHTSQEIDQEVAKRNPKAAARDRVKPLAEDLFQAQITFDRKTLDFYKRIQSLLAQKGKPCTLSDAIAAAADYYLDAEDPVRKAERSARRSQEKAEKASAERAQTPAQAQKELCLNRVQKVTFKKRIPPTAAQKDAVTLKYEGRCAWRDEHGKRCNSDRWTANHHIKEVQNGGTNDLENLVTLCSFHHALVHKKSAATEGHITWQK